MRITSLLRVFIGCYTDYKVGSCPQLTSFWPKVRVHMGNISIIVYVVAKVAIFN